jgi:EAL domain-containing protein (putative c-di-GMP-specific phosphodiesterase class I)
VEALVQFKGTGVGAARIDLPDGRQVKLDRSCIAKERDHPALLKAIVALAVQLDLTVTAEGIETEAQCEQLRDMGCHLWQGYLFGHPADAATTQTILSTDRLWLPDTLLGGGPR